MNDATPQAPPPPAAWFENKKVWLAVGALAVGLILVFAPFPWNKPHSIHPKDGIEFRLASGLAEALRTYRGMVADGRMPDRLKDLEAAGLLPPPDPMTHGTLQSLADHYFYYPDGVPTPSRSDGRLIILNATSLTVRGVTDQGRYGIWLDRDDQISIVRWIPETEAQEYLGIIAGRHRP